MNWELIVVWLIALIGVGFMLVSSIGLLRLPGVHARMHAASKASTVGISLILLAVGMHFGEGKFLLMIALIILLFSTAPVATTAMARAAYRSIPRRQSHLSYSDLHDPRYLPRNGPFVDAEPNNAETDRAAAS